MAVQDALYALEVGSGRQLVQRGFLLILFMAIALLYGIGQFRGLREQEAMDAAQLGRQLSRGEGYTTKFVRPLEIGQLKERAATQSEGTAPDVMKMPEIYQSPLYPALLATLFKVTRVSFEMKAEEAKNFRIFAPERFMMIFNQFLVLVTTLVLFVCASRLFDLRVGTLSAALYVLSDLVWQFSLSGLATTWLMLLLLLLVLSLHEALQADEEERLVSVLFWVVVSAVVMVLALYTKLLIAWMLAPYLLLLLIGFPRKLYLMPLALGIVVLTTAPWLMRNHQVSGSIFGGNTLLINRGDSKFGGSSLERSYGPEVEESPVKAAARKILVGWKYHFTNFWALTGSSVAILLFGAALLHPFRRRRAQLLRFFLLGAGLFLVTGSIIFDPEPGAISAGNSLAIFWPGCLIFGCAFFYVLLDRLDLELEVLRAGVIVLFSVTHAMPLLLTLAPPGEPPFRYPPYFPPMIGIVTNWVQKDELMMSDMPWATAWYGDRVSLSLPATVREFYRIHDDVHKVALGLLTPITGTRPLNEIEKGEWKEWAVIIQRKGLPNLFPLQNFTPLPPDNDYLVVADRVRWR